MFTSWFMFYPPGSIYEVRSLALPSAPLFSVLLYAPLKWIHKFTSYSISGSAGIEMVTEKEHSELSVKDTPLCSSCQMLVLWIQNQLKQKANKERVFNYVNQVSPLIYHIHKLMLFYISI